MSEQGRSVNTVKAKRRLAGLLAACMTMAALMTGSASADSVTVTTDKLNVRAKPDAASNSIGVARRGEELSFVSEKGSWIQVKFDGQAGFVAEEYVRLDRDDIKEDVEENTEAYSGQGVTTDRVNIRELPMTDASVVKVAAKKATVEITGVCGEWYRVKYGGKTGYLMGEYLTLKSADEQAQATAKPEETKAPEQSGTDYGEGVFGEVTARVNMRAAATTDSSVLKVLDEGASISILGETGKWYRIYTEGKQGYIVKTCARIVGEGESVRPTATPTPTPEPTAAPGQSSEETVYDRAKTGTATERVNMRQSPSASAKIVTVLAKGAKATVTGEAGGWYLVTAGGKTGYVSANYMKVTEAGEEITPAPTAAPTATPAPTQQPETEKDYAESKTGRTTARVNMRKSASTSSSVVSVVASGTKVTVTGEAGSFYKVSVGSKTGYISGSYIRLVEEEEPEETVKETIYSSEKDGKTTLRVNMRDKPDGEVLRVLPADAKVKLLGESGGWYKVKYSGSTGYVSKSYVKEYDEEQEATSGEGTKGYITASSVNMRKGPGTGYGVVRVLKRGAEIRYYSLSDGWYLIKSGGDVGYVSSEYVSKSQPEEEESDSSGRVILSDWFTGDIQSVFDRGDTATVTDIKTGLKFKATRTGGYYHADAQPATSSDTKIMYQIYGNEWKWDRRAIWVTVDGKTYAASMNGMPHGETDVITGNNFDGCFCIHFRNSKTHEGNRVDSAHQDCIQEAYEAGNK